MLQVRRRSGVRGGERGKGGGWRLFEAPEGDCRCRPTAATGPRGQRPHLRHRGAPGAGRGFWRASRAATRGGRGGTPRRRGGGAPRTGIRADRAPRAGPDASGRRPRGRAALVSDGAALPAADGRGAEESRRPAAAPACGRRPAAGPLGPCRQSNPPSAGESGPPGPALPAPLPNLGRRGGARGGQGRRKGAPKRGRQNGGCLLGSA